MAAVFGLLFAACCSAAQARQGAAPKTFRPISFAKIGVQIPAGTPWAHLQENDPPLPCAGDRVLTWSAKANETFQDPELERIFRAEIAAAGMSVAGDPTNLFEADSKSADLQIGALITQIEATFCSKRSLKDAFFNPSHVIVSGSTSMAVEWQVYSVLQGRVIARIQTHGKYEDQAGLDAGNVIIIQRAFADSVRALASSDTFRKILSDQASQQASQPQDQIVISGIGASARSPAEARDAVATIFTGEAMGSGFLVSRDGYLLTNRHVVGDAARVRIRWSDRTESVGDVIRSDPRRDVALVKVVAGERLVLALRTEPTVAGEPVFAIGTPLEKAFQNTITQGVISGIRRLGDQDFVQSDVAVDHGNSGGPLIDQKGRVLAITQWGYSPDGVSHNLNFFIPINDALAVLGVKVEPIGGAAHLPVQAAKHRVTSRK